MSTAPHTPLSEEQSRTLGNALAQVAEIVAGRVYSPRIKCLSVEQVCDITGLKKSTIYDMVAKGEFPKPQEGFRVNRWRESAIIAWMDKNDPNLRERKG